MIYFIWENFTKKKKCKNKDIIPTQEKKWQKLSRNQNWKNIVKNYDIREKDKIINSLAGNRE